MDSSLKNLPVDERIRLVEDLWDSIASDQNSISLSSAQKAELDKRLDAYEVTKYPGRPADEVISEIRKKL
ncbi:MAG: addiction module protein [Candidatus Dadabacteria bacterium]|nr:addiction module protein [Candidatus Dadabacteria bacterium]MDE0663621.1 addiction module protein [Candidatus Dadabacteria bacterium]